MSGAQWGGFVANIQFAISRRVMHVVFQRPTHRNAITAAMYETLIQLLVQAEVTPQVNAVMFSGAGRLFTTGSEADATGETGRAALQFLVQLANFSKPLVAAVEGAAEGVGAQMLLLCDIVYAEADALFSIGHDWTPTTEGVNGEPVCRLGEPLRHQRTMALLGSRGRVTAAMAVDMGLVYRVLPADDVLYYAIQHAEQIADRASEGPFNKEHAASC